MTSALRSLGLQCNFQNVSIALSRQNFSTIPELSQEVNRCRGVCTQCHLHVCVCEREREKGGMGDVSIPFVYIVCFWCYMFCLFLKHAHPRWLLFVMNLSLSVTMAGNWLTVHRNNISFCQGMEKNYCCKYCTFSADFSERLTGDRCFNLTDGSDQQQCLPYLGPIWSSANISVYEACRLVMYVVVSLVGPYA